MKSKLMIPAAAAAMLALHPAGGVWAQDACSKSYVSCIDVCLKHPGKTYQDRCIEACQGKNEQCAEKIYGERRQQQPAAVAQDPREATDALAKTGASDAIARQGRDAAQPGAKPQVHPQVRVPVLPRQAAEPAPAQTRR